MTNGERIRSCETDEQLVNIFFNMLNNSLYSGGENNKLLTVTEYPKDLLIWLNKESDYLDEDIFRVVPLEEVKIHHVSI